MNFRIVIISMCFKEKYSICLKIQSNLKSFWEKIQHDFEQSTYVLR